MERLLPARNPVGDQTPQPRCVPAREPNPQSLVYGWPSNQLCPGQGWPLLLTDKTWGRLAMRGGVPPLEEVETWETVEVGSLA